MYRYEMKDPVSNLQVPLPYPHPRKHEAVSYESTLKSRMLRLGFP